MHKNIINILFSIERYFREFFAFYKSKSTCSAGRNVNGTAVEMIKIAEHK